MELETINKLYLELSQVATAQTKSDIELSSVKLENARMRKLLLAVFNDDHADQLTDPHVTKFMREFTQTMSIEAALVYTSAATKGEE